MLRLPGSLTKATERTLEQGRCQRRAIPLCTRTGADILVGCSELNQIKTHIDSLIERQNIDQLDTRERMWGKYS